MQALKSMAVTPCPQPRRLPGTEKVSKIVVQHPTPQPVAFDCRDPREWRFDKDDVPDSELMACCYWEYAREAKRIRECTPDKAKTLRGTELRRHREFCFKMWSAPYTLISECIFVPYPTLDDPPSFPKPWQSLSAEERKKRSHPICLSDVRSAVETAFLSDAKSLGEKAELAHREWRRMEDSRQRRRLPMVLEPKVSLIYGGMEVCAFNVLWERFDNAKIKAAFAKWVDASRPPTFPEPNTGVGHKPVDWRKKLRDLGVMRLMNFSTVAGLPARCPEAAQYFERWESKHWSAARKRALKNFRSVFPFLPEKEYPLHATTKGGRAKL